ncbi:MAG TPA: hypothetical protein VGW12_04355, partial [Pyrinomonadaceae bacterium]|nr:hypothetical protein [Pyrinomonadaceae bacterium]
SRLNEPGTQNLTELYRSLEFRREDVRLLPLSVDSMTVNAFKEKIPAANQVAFDLSSAAALDASLAPHRGTTVFVLGHVESNSFVVKDAGNQAVFRIPIADLEAMAHKHDISIFALGCHSASSTDASGVINKFNTVDAINRFNKAMRADNYMNFFDRLAGDDIFMVLDNSVLGGARNRMALNVYEERGAGGRSRRAERIGSVTILNPTAYQAARRMAMANAATTPTPTGGENPTSGASAPVGNGGVLLLAAGGLVVASGLWFGKRHLDSKRTDGGSQFVSILSTETPAAGRTRAGLDEQGTASDGEARQPPHTDLR